MNSAIARLLVMVLAMVSVCNAGSHQQALDSHDVLILKTGGVLRGFITELVRGSHVAVEVANSDTISVAYDSVEMILEAGAYARYRRELAAEPTPRSSVTHAYNAYSELLIDDSHTYLGVGFRDGVMLSEDIYAGLGIGWDNLRHLDLVPICAHVRKGGMLGRPSLFLYMDFGYAFGWIRHGTGAEFGGPTVGVGFGLDRSIGQDESISLSLGYRYQEAEDLSETAMKHDFLALSLSLEY